MSKSNLSRRTFMRLAVSTGVLLGSAGLTSRTHAQGGSIDYSSLVSRYLGPAKDEATGKALLAEIEALTAEQYLTFYELAASRVAEMAAPYEPGVKDKTRAAVDDHKRLMAEALKAYGRPYNKLTWQEKATLVDVKPTSRLTETRGSKGRGLQRPRMQVPCFTYTRNAFISLLPAWPNYINYYPAAGAPACGDVDLEIVYGGRTSTMYQATSPGFMYPLGLQVSGRLQVLRDFGNTGALIGRNAVNTIFFRSEWYAANSLAMA